MKNIIGALLLTPFITGVLIVVIPCLLLGFCVMQFFTFVRFFFRTVFLFTETLLDTFVKLIRGYEKKQLGRFDYFNNRDIRDLQKEKSNGKFEKHYAG